MSSRQSLELFRSLQQTIAIVRAGYEENERLSRHTSMELQLLLALETPLKLGDLSKALHCQPSNITSLVDSLEVKQLVTREPHPSDRRAKQLTLTKAGNKERQLLLKVADQMFREVTGLDDQSISEILAILNP